MEELCDRARVSEKVILQLWRGELETPSLRDLDSIFQALELARNLDPPALTKTDPVDWA